MKNHERNIRRVQKIGQGLLVKLYGKITTNSELQVLKLKYGSEYVSDAIVFLKIICSIRE